MRVATVPVSDEARKGVCRGLHGACARRLAEAGCSKQEIKAISGRMTEAEVTRYTTAADQKVVAKSAMSRLVPAESETRSANPFAKVNKSEG